MLHCFRYVASTFEEYVTRTLYYVQKVVFRQFNLHVHTTNTIHENFMYVIRGVVLLFTPLHIYVILKHVLYIHTHATEIRYVWVQRTHIFTVCIINIKKFRFICTIICVYYGSDISITIMNNTIVTIVILISKN